MDLQLEKLLDPTGLKLLRALQTDARLSFSELGRRVNLSTPAVSERVRRMEDAGLILGYHAAVDAAKLGWPITAFIRLFTSAKHYPRFLELARTTPEVVECYHVTGSEAFVIKARVESVGKLEALIERLNPFGETSTSVVLSAPVQKQVVEPPPGRE